MKLKCELDPEDTPIDPRQPWVGHPREAEFEVWYAKHLAEQERCVCEYDGGYGDDGSEVRRFPKLGCPVHAEEDEEFLNG